jgi:dihydroorotase-like cyclic amidohydrolase
MDIIRILNKGASERRPILDVLNNALNGQDKDGKTGHYNLWIVATTILVLVILEVAWDFLGFINAGKVKQKTEASANIFLDDSEDDDGDCTTQIKLQELIDVFSNDRVKVSAVHEEHPYLTVPLSKLSGEATKSIHVLIAALEERRRVESMYSKALFNAQKNLANENMKLLVDS